jgi:hypothetical protein
MPVQAALRGEIWFVKLPSDPKDKGPRPVVIAPRMPEMPIPERILCWLFRFPLQP